MKRTGKAGCFLSFPEATMKQRTAKVHTAIIVVFLGSSIDEYRAAFPEVLDPALRTLACPRCGAGALRRHDSRSRGVWDGSDDQPIIPMLRVRCPGCRATHTILPDFLTPYRRYPTPLREAVVAGVGLSPPCDARTARRWVCAFRVTIAAVAALLAATISAKLAAHRQDASTFPSCPHPHGYTGLRWLRETCLQFGHAPPATGLFGWTNSLCTSAPVPLWI